MTFITLRGSRTMDRQDCEYFGLSHYKEKRGEYANTFNAEAKITAFAKTRSTALMRQRCAWKDSSRSFGGYKQISESGQ
ncbi:hypothetical protein [Pseudomonas amygdali]|uniref:hypothetical protein n=1 Tax=Pseudomonas amygdali TaxID=47877 RepID=UPI0006CC8E35|nr:hypothetical protein [Pseudomonas amygdali]KPB12035.1 Uncharacterized protein AC516_1590 [Pseudomonas amygdali pv. sesami]RMT98878.1 hypothetical protein ALP38_00601 [Pseudomonas amygdali pv. sesami]RMU04934.1 hypothetical protein ALP37_01089 [Pseudomonas amygdali pv. sesami]